MAESKLYEVRQRGAYMLMGYYFYAENHESAAAMYMGGLRRDNIVIQAEPGMGNGDWCLVSVNGDRYNPHVQLNNKIIHPYDNTTKKRLAFAKACEAFCQRLEKIRSLEFADFDKQSKKYEAKEWTTVYSTTREEYEKGSIDDSTACIKYSEKAEAYAIEGKHHSARDYVSKAAFAISDASGYSYISHAQGSIKPNKADLLFANAYKKYSDTNEKVQKLKDEQVINETVEAIKECAIAEAAIMIGDEATADKAISIAKSLCEEADTYAERTCKYKATELNPVQKAVKRAEIQLDKTRRKIWDYEMRTKSPNRDKSWDSFYEKSKHPHKQEELEIS